MKIGITGGIGSGKSYVCKRLEARGIQVYDCDSAAKRLIRTSPELQQQLKALVGSLEKADMAKFLLESEQNAKAIDAIVHPAVFRDFEQSGLQWMESAILYESGAIRLVDKAIVVTAPDEVRIRRVMERDHISREKVLEWMSRQLPQDEVRRRAHFEIVNDGTTDIDKQIKQILNAMKETILAIAGKPGLYKLVTRGKNSLIVEALDATHRRLPAFATDRITSLGDVAMFTQTDDVPLMDVLENIKTLEEGKKASIATASNKGLPTGSPLLFYRISKRILRRLSLFLTRNHQPRSRECHSEFLFICLRFRASHPQRGETLP